MAARAGPGLTVVVVGVALGIIDISAVNSILPELRRDLGATASDLQWVVSGYLLAYGLAMIVTGRIGDARGRRPTFLVGVGLFTAASLVAALAPNPGVLLVARLAQGFGGGFLNPQATALIRDLVSGPARARVFGLYVAVAASAVAVGPFIGGVLGSVDWRWVFWVNVPLGVLVLAGGMRWLPRAPAPGAERPDVLGVALLWAGLAALLAPLFELTELPTGAVVASLAAAVLILAGFVAWEGRLARGGGAPVVDLGLFRQRSYSAGVALNVTYLAGYTALFYVLTLYLRSGLGLSQVEAGAMQLPVALGAAVAAPLAGRRAPGRPRVVELAGVVAMVVGTLAVWALAVGLGHRTDALLCSLVAPLVVIGAGGALVMSMNIDVTNAEMPAGEAGSANAVRQTSARVGSSVGTAVVGAVFGAVLGTSSVSTARSDWDRALSAGMALSAGFLALTLVPVAVDLVGAARERRASQL
ncbi:MFS transporter [Cellulomonas timonensis]|uniref:MFS transporter n=1 Tax=Cellulomonas timonensis TaxID=1689271 RepID=UPI00082DF404|nr:MFS transporter [Cellulomonas timonensis]